MILIQYHNINKNMDTWNNDGDADRIINDAKNIYFPHPDDSSDECDSNNECYSNDECDSNDECENECRRMKQFKNGYQRNFNSITGELKTRILDFTDAHLVKKIQFEECFDDQLDDIGYYINLEEIEFDQDFSHSLYYLKYCEKLKSIKISKGYPVEDTLWALEKCKKLEYLEIYHCGDIRQLKYVNQLKKLYLHNIVQNDIKYLKHMKYLEKLKFSICNKSADDDILKKLSNEKL